MITFPNAKINIGLNVVSKRKDGYHNLESIFYPIELCDVLEIVEAKKSKITTSGIKIEGDVQSNLVLKAYKLLNNKYQIPEVAIHLHKNIPFGAGLGGGSSDAAFTLKMLNELFQLNLKEEQLIYFAEQIGADCPFFLKNKPCFASGIGNRLEPILLDLSKYKIVVVKPDIFVGTPEAYRNIIPKKPAFNLHKLNNLPIEEWKNVAVNDFEENIFSIYPEVRKIKEILYEQGALYAAMTGSGSAVFGIYRHLPVNFNNYLPKGIYIYR